MIRVLHQGLSGDEGDRTPDLRNAIAALSQLSYVPKSKRERHIQGFSAGTAKPIPGYIRSQAKRAGGNIGGRYFAAPSRRRSPQAATMGAGHNHSDMTLRRVSAYR